jgi:hypothetical protein
MPFKINDFKKNLTYGGARPSLFQVELSLPTQLGDAVNNGVDGRGLTGVTQKLTFLANAASIPGSKIPEISIPYFGRKVKVAGAREFADWTVTIINDEDFLVRKALEHWMASINGHATNIRNSGVNASPSSYQATAYVKHYSKGPTENPIRSYKFVNIFPTDIAEIELNWATTDSIEEFRVTFAYDWWEIDTSGDITPPTGNSLA